MLGHDPPPHGDMFLHPLGEGKLILCLPETGFTPGVPSTSRGTAELQDFALQWRFLKVGIPETAPGTDLMVIDCSMIQ